MAIIYNDLIRAYRFTISEDCHIRFTKLTGYKSGIFKDRDCRIEALLEQRASIETVLTSKQVHPIVGNGAGVDKVRSAHRVPGHHDTYTASFHYFGLKIISTIKQKRVESIGFSVIRAIGNNNNNATMNSLLLPLTIPSSWQSLN